MRRKFVMLVLTAFLVVSSAPDCIFADTVDNVSLEEEELKSMKLVAENDSLELYVDEVDTDVAVKDKTSGEIWFTNPIDTEQDSISTNYYLKALKSQLKLTYINENTQISTMDNYSNSIEDEQFEMEEIEDGITITYSIGDSVSFLAYPEVITEERMNKFMEKMDQSQLKKIKRNYTLYCLEDVSEEEQEELLKQYPVLEKSNIYVLRSGVKDYIREEIAEYFEEAGYTEEDYQIDSSNLEEAEEDDSLWFEVPLTYQLDGDDLIVTVDPEQVSYNTNGYYLVSVDILPYFGASLSEDGYLFVPDGSGALINFNNGKVTESSYSAAVYGQDETMIYTAWNESQIDSLNTVKMPVFGIKDEEKALFAIIESGDAYATINADIAGKTTAYNNAYASFTYLQYGETSLDDMVGANSYYMYSEPAFEESYQIRYQFLSGEEADYSGMAAGYQSYLVENGVLGEQIESQEIPFFAEYIGAVEKAKTFLGVKYDATVALTTFEQAEEITGLLTEQGVSNITTVYSGWMNGGLHGTAATQLSIESKLSSGGESLKEFQTYMEEVGNLYFTLELQYVYQDQLFDGYSNTKYAPRYFDNTYVKINDYGLASRVSEGTLASLISPYYVENLTEKLGTKLQKKNITGVNLGTVSWELYSDFSSDKYTDRQMAETQNTSAMQSLQSNEITMLGDNANAYTWGYVDELINVPLASNDYRIIDEEIPFYEMVVHGYMQYAGEAFNLADDYTTIFLKSVESGAGVNFKWIYESNSLLKETDYDELYSVNYESWFEQAVQTYEQMNQDLGYLQNQRIVSHESVGEAVVKITYEDDSIVYVNYSDTDVLVDGNTVKAENYAVKRGGN